MKWPLKFCLAFDDGFKTQATIAAPLLKKYGFKAAFNVPTEFMDPATRKLTQEQVWDCRLDGNEDNLMDWGDVRRLIAEGHEVYPHTLGHIDLLALEKEGKINEICRQVAESKRQFIEHLGFAPKFFCSPHNSNSALISRIIHENGMEIFACNRRNFPTHPTANPQRIDVGDYLRGKYRKGAAVVDIMMHGVESSRGGWEPFADAAEFEAFLISLKSVVDEGFARVVPYSNAHRTIGRFALPLRFYDRVVRRIRREFILRTSHA